MNTKNKQGRRARAAAVAGPQFPAWARLASASAVCLAAAVQPALAQQADVKASDVPGTESAPAPTSAPVAPAAVSNDKNVVTVTGTSIRGIAPTGASLMKMSRDDIAATGASTATELLRSLPELGSFNATGNNTGSNQANFVDQPAIHGIGVGNGGGGLTLILLDGHRLPGAGINQTAPDAAVIPHSALERVEVMADGGSSIYGSDAVAGVINFVTRRNFDGAETSVQAGYADGYRTKNVSQLFGKTWDGGALLLDYEHAENTALNGTARSYVVNDQTPWGGPDSRSSTCSPANVSAGGVNYALSASGAVAAGVSNRCETNRGNDLYPAQHRDQVFAKLRHDVSQTVSLYGSFLFSDRKMDDHVAGAGITSGGLAVNVPSSSPYYRPIAGAPVGATQSVTYDPAADFGSTFSNRVSTLTSSSVLGANVELGNDWTAQLEFNYGLEHDDVREHGINQSLASDAAAAGSFNPYGVGSATNPAVLAAIGNYETRYAGRQSIKDGRLKLDGPLWNISGGAVRAAVGADVRQEQFQGLVAAGAVGSAVTPYTTDAKRNISSVFGELFVPLVGKANQLPGVRKLDLSVAARYDHYNDVGGTTNPKAGLTWTVADGAQVRLSAGRSFHAPSLADAGTAIDTRAIRFGCVPGVFIGCAGAGPSDYTAILAGGNSTLKPETAQTYNVGFDLGPALLHGFKASMTYFLVNYNNVITFPTFAPVTNPDSAYAKYRTVRPAGISDAQWLAVVQPLLQGFRHDGQVYPDLSALPTAVYDLRRQNFADERIAGVDFDFGYGFNNALGKFSFDLAGTRMVKFEQLIPGVAAPLELLGTDYAVRTKMRGQLGWAQGDLAGSVFVNYTGGYRNANATPVQQVGGFTTVDSHFAWSLKEGGMLANTQLSLDISNLFNKAPPVYFSSGTNGITGFDPSVASPLGRVISLALHKAW